MIRGAGERKFNPYHDPDNGQFTDALHGSASLGGATKTPAPQPTAAPAPKVDAVKPKHARRTAPPEPAMPRGWREGGDMPVSEVEIRADHAMDQYYENRRRGMEPDDAAAWAAASESESRGDHTIRQEGGGPGRGLYQWGAHEPEFDRRRDFERYMKVSIERSTREQQFRFRDYELTQGKEKRKKVLIDAAIGAGNKAYVITTEYLRPSKKYIKAASRANLAEAILRRGQSEEQRQRSQPKIPALRRSVFQPAVD